MRPLAKSTSRFESSLSTPCRLRITGIALLEVVGDLLGVVEAARDDEVHTGETAAIVDRYGAGSTPRRRAGRPQRHAALARALRLAPLVHFGRAPARRQSPYIRAFAVGALGLLGHVTVLVPFFLFGYAEIDERPVPDVREPHIGSIVAPGAVDIAGEPRTLEKLTPPQPCARVSLLSSRR